MLKIDQQDRNSDINLCTVSPHDFNIILVCQKQTNSSSNRAAKVKVKGIHEQDRVARPELRLSGVAQTKKDQLNLLSSGRAYQVIYAGIAWT